MGIFVARITQFPTQYFVSIARFSSFVLRLE